LNNTNTRLADLSATNTNESIALNLDSSAINLNESANMSQQEVKPTESKLMYAIRELLNTEKDYVNDLAILIEVNFAFVFFSFGIFQIILFVLFFSRNTWKLLRKGKCNCHKTWKTEKTR
jgi:hypothetical protein